MDNQNYDVFFDAIIRQDLLPQAVLFISLLELYPFISNQYLPAGKPARP